MEDEDGSSSSSFDVGLAVDEELEDGDDGDAGEDATLEAVIDVIVVDDEEEEGAS